ncbi:hypothetical protein ABGT92_07800 [Streptomyces cinereoruber]|uniref:hypothetical protein n=1 Tax=Streptomyces cinereoruber TaxID=67260 RepID=UPI00345D1C9E
MRNMEQPLLDAFAAARLSSQQSGIAQRLLEALDPLAFLSSHTAGANSALLTLARAHAALTGHAAEGQPHAPLLLQVLDSTAGSLTVSVDAFRAGGGHQDLAKAQTELNAVILALRPHVQRRIRTALPTAAATAQRLQPLLLNLESAVQGWLGPLWNGQITDLELLESMCAEVGVLVALKGRDGSSLRKDLLKLLLRGTPTELQMHNLLWPAVTRHRVTLLVHGARVLQGLERFLPQAEQWPLNPRQASDRLPDNQRLRDFVSRLPPRTGSATLVEFHVEAPDTQTAYALGRRQLTEALDQYSAGERLLELTLAPQGEALAARSGGYVIRWTGNTPTARTAYPLTIDWPVRLRPALRGAHLARRVDAPMTSSALCWSALESTGLNSGQIKLLAKSCALQTLRQQLVFLYTMLTTAARDRLTHQRYIVERLQNKIKSHERSMQRCQMVDSEQAQKSFRMHKQMAEQDKRCLEQELLKEKTARADHVTWTRDLDAQVTVVGTKPHLADLDTWVDVLMPPRQPSARLAAAQQAVSGLSAYAGGYVVDHVDLWRRRLQNPVLLDAWIDKQRNVYTSALSWLYVTRNLSFHGGVFQAPADTLTAHAGRSLVDMTLEFLGNRYTRDRGHGRNETQPIDSYQDLAKRFDDLRDHLGQPGATCHPLRLRHITGPSQTWWQP